MPVIWLVGMMGAGKSAVAPLVAADLGWEWIDTDQQLGSGGRSAADWLREDPKGFRQAEHELVVGLSPGAWVVACGGGVVLDDIAVDWMRRRGLVVWLDAPVEVLAERVGDGSERPLLGGDPRAALQRIFGERAERYRAAAHVTVDASGSPAQVAASVMRQWLAPTRSASRPHLDWREGHTQVWLGETSGVESAIFGAYPTDRLFVLVQPSTPESIVREIDPLVTQVDAEFMEVPDGEAAKTMAVAEEVCRWLETAGMGRGADLLVAVGGGALTDLAGFVAAVYRRGVPLCLVPTTLVAAIDAAIGGKSALNLEAKNQIGLFRHPYRVVIDLETLAALPTELVKEGAAEALKAGLIGDPVLVDLYERHGLAAPLDQVVERAIRVKAEIVSRDFRETGERAHLNYGHTVGHAVELAGGISHGAAVAVGMVAAGRASAIVAGFDAEERQREVISRLGLPVAAPDLDPSTVRQLIAADKKLRRGARRMVVLEEIGRPRVVVVDDATVTAALAAVGIGGLP